MILDRVLEGRRVVVCAGAGGVGKTTVAAALGSELASRGVRALVLTIDPARRAKPSYMPSNPVASSERSRRNVTPAIRSTAAKPSRPARMPGRSRNRRARPSTNRVSRPGASRKSSAFRDGGVSSTITSYSPLVCSSYSRSIAMYSCAPATAADTCR